MSLSDASAFLGAPDHPVSIASESSPDFAVDNGAGIEAIYVGDDGGNFYQGTSEADRISGLGGDDDLYGDTGNDTILGGDDDDSLFGEAGDDKLSGGRGDDFLHSGTGADILNGGTGFDVAVFSSDKFASSIPISVDFSDFVAGQTTTVADGPEGGTATLIGIEKIVIYASLGDDRIIGAEGPSGISTLGGDDYVNARGGDDIIEDVGGSSTLLGGDGDDQFFVSGESLLLGVDDGGHDLIRGGGGRDTLTLDWSMTNLDVTMTTGSGHTLVNSANGEFSADMTGVETFDITVGGSATLAGLAGDDVLTGGYDGTNNLSGAGGSDILIGGESIDNLLGGQGNDTFWGGAGDDTLKGGDGIDTYVMQVGASVSGANGLLFDASTLELGSGTSVFDDRMGGHDTISGFENVEIYVFADSDDTAIGTAGDDVIHDYFGTDLMSGGAGDDLMLQSDAFPEFDKFDLDDTFDGGAGIDTLSWTQSIFFDVTAVGWEFNLQAGTVVGTAPHTDTISHDTISHFEHVVGSGAMDTILGSARSETLDGYYGDDRIAGRDGKDVLIGGFGDDTLVGGGGRDLLTGGADADTFVFQSTSDSSGDQVDKITDLSSQDRIDLSAIDADIHQAGDQAFHLVDAFSHHAAELILSYSAGHATTLSADVDGDGVADFSVTLRGDHTDFSNFVL